VHSPSRSPSQPPGRVLQLIIVLPVSLLRSPRRRCVFHVIVSFRTSSLPSHSRRRVGRSSLSVLWSSLALAWLHCPCPEFPGTSIRRTRCSRLGERGPSSSLAHSFCSGITHRTLIVSVVLMRFAYRVDSPALPSSLLSSSSITPGASCSIPPSLLNSFLLLLYSHHHLLDSSLLLAIHSPRRHCRFPPSLSLCPHIGLLPHGSPLHLSPSSVRPSREYEPTHIPLEREGAGEAVSLILSGLGRYLSGPHPSKEGRGS